MFPEISRPVCTLPVQDRQSSSHKVSTSKYLLQEFPLPTRLTDDSLLDSCPGGFTLFLALQTPSEATAAPSPGFLMRRCLCWDLIVGRLAISTCFDLLPMWVSGTQPPRTPTCLLTPTGPLGRRAFQHGWEAHHEDLLGGELGSSSSNVVCPGRESCLKYSLMCLSLHVHISASERHPCVNVRMYVHILTEWIFPTVLLTFVHVSMSWDLGIRSGKQGEDGIPWHQRPSCGGRVIV